jgi:RNA polymerase sigma factor (sigma-70 family)
MTQSKEDSRNPKELKGGHLKWLDRQVYKGIGSIQATLNKAERKMLVDQLAISLDRYETMVLGMAPVRAHLYALFNQMVESGISTSQLSSKFNMSVKGHNSRIRDDIDNAFMKAYMLESEGDPSGAAKGLLRVGLSNKVLFSDDVVEMVEQSNSAASHELAQVNIIRRTLFLSALKMVVGIARRHTVRLDGNTVEWADLVQEATIASMRAVQAYHPIADGNTFTSYIYTYVNGEVSKKVNETTRAVVIPRTTMDRFTCVQQAMDNLAIVDSDIQGGGLDGTLIEGRIGDDRLDALTAEANRLRSRGKPSYTSKETESLLILSREEVSLDMTVAHRSQGEQVFLTFGESDEFYENTRNSQPPSLEERMDGALLDARLMKIIRKYTTNEEYTLMELRYGMGVVRGFKAVAEQYNLTTGRPMNKGKVSQIEQSVLSRLREAAKSDADLARSFRELIESLAYVGG